MNKENRTPHWIPCPICKEKTDVKVFEDTVLLNFPLCCPVCKCETIISIINLRMTKCK